MKLLMSAVLWMFVASSAAAETPPASVALGQLQDDVRSRLGQPVGEAHKGSRTIWLYPKGTVEFEGGRVVSSDLLTDGAYAEAQARKAREAEAQRQAEANAPARPAAKPVRLAAPPEANRAPPATSERFVRPFIRPTFADVQYYNQIPVVFEMAKWPPGMLKAFDASVEIPVVTGQRRTTYDTLLYELKKYPAEMLEQTLRCIYMIRNIRGQGEGNDKDPAALAFYTEGIVLEHTCFLHHEYGHELNYLFADVFPGKEFGAVSGAYKGFDDRPRLNQKDLWNLGYTSNYGMSSVAEDFAEFCDELYLQPLAFFTAARENPKLAAKFAIVRAFLEMVKSRTTGDTAPMDEAYFSRFDRNRWRP